MFQYNNYLLFTAYTDVAVLVISVKNEISQSLEMPLILY